MPKHQAPIITDPGISFGPYRIMRRTDGLGVVIDRRFDHGDKQRYPFEGKGFTVAESISHAKLRWEKEGKPSWGDE